MLVRLGMHEVCYQFHMRVYKHGSWVEYAVVQSPGRYSVEVWLN